MRISPTATPIFIEPTAARSETTNGLATTVPAVAIANFYGRNSLGSIRGINEISIGGGQALGAIFSGIIYDITKSYTLVFPTLAIMALFSALAFLFVKPPQKQ